MNRLNVTILGICETGWASHGDFISNTLELIHASEEKSERDVGLILDNDIRKYVLGYRQISDRTMLVKLKGMPFNIAVSVVYGPAAQRTEEEIDNYYSNVLSCVKSQEITIIMRDLNAIVGKNERMK